MIATPTKSELIAFAIFATVFITCMAVGSWELFWWCWHRFTFSWTP